MAITNKKSTKGSIKKTTPSYNNVNLKAWEEGTILVDEAFVFKNKDGVLQIGVTGKTTETHTQDGELYTEDAVVFTNADWLKAVICALKDCIINFDQMPDGSYKKTVAEIQFPSED